MIIAAAAVLQCEAEAVQFEIGEALRAECPEDRRKVVAHCRNRRVEAGPEMIRFRRPAFADGGFPVFICDEPVGMFAVQAAGGGCLKRHQPDAGFHSGLADSPGDGFKRFRPAVIPVEPVAHEGLVAVVDLDHPRRITLPVEP